MVGWLSGCAMAAAVESSCAACHRAIQGVPYVQHDFSDWKASPHARARVSCEACHGGDPAQKDKAQAHRAMLSSRDAKSPVYYTRVPATCGACHQAEFAAFRKSAHYQELRRSGRGPNCVTCHGSMANSVLGPRGLETTCALCHRKPTQAYEARIALDRCQAELARLEAQLKAARGSGADLARQKQELEAAQGLYRQAAQGWHAFKIPKVLQAAADISRRVKAAAAEVRLKAGPRP